MRTRGILLLCGAFLLGYLTQGWQQSTPTVPVNQQISRQDQAQGPLSPSEATIIIHKLAADPKNIKLTRHAKKRLSQRGISTEDMVEGLRNGVVRDAAHKGSKGDWLYKIYDERPAINNTLEAVLIIEGDRLRVVTIMWDK